MSLAFIPSCHKRTSHKGGCERRLFRRTSAVARLTPIQSRAQCTIVPSAAMTDVLGTQDLVDGLLLAFALAFLFSVLQQRSRQEDTPTPQDESKDGRVVFDADAWKEMSRPENYVYFNSKLREPRKEEPAKQEKKWVLISLLVLFVPIFSAELFLALSRQFLCGGDPFTQSAWALDLCSPHF